MWSVKILLARVYETCLNSRVSELLRFIERKIVFNPVLHLRDMNYIRGEKLLVFFI